MRQHADDMENQFQPSLLAKMLHSLPHYNVTFHLINSTFRPKNEVYVESLGMLGSVPAALLIVSLIGLLLYLLTRCCDRKPRPAHSITSLKVTLTFVTVLCCSAIGLGLYGNDDLHNGLLDVLQAGRKVDTIVSGVRNQTTILESTLSQKIRPQLSELADIFDNPISNQTALSQLLVSLSIVQGNVTVATNAAGDIRRPLMGVTMTVFLGRGDQWELIRWPGTVAILALLLALCAVLLVGVARHSRCALILFSVCGLLAVTGSWLMSGIYLASSVAVGDLCMDPADYLVSEAPSELPTEVLLYYTQCEMARSNPFTQRLRESQNAINNARSAMSTVARISLVHFKSSGLQPKLGAVTADLNTSERLLTQLTALVDCKIVHLSYISASKGLCEAGLWGLVLMLVASFAAAILLTIMVWVDSHTWIYIRNRHDYAQVDELSYVSHQQMQQAHNMQQQTMMASRTLPRNHHHKGPPVISGSYTLQHPRNNKHNEMNSAHNQHAQHTQQQLMQANARPLGTHTLGRLPSHNHSPSHHGIMANGQNKHASAGPNNACSDTGPTTAHHPDINAMMAAPPHIQQNGHNPHGYYPQVNYSTHPNYKHLNMVPNNNQQSSEIPPYSMAQQQQQQQHQQMNVQQNHYTTHGGHPQMMHHQQQHQQQSGPNRIYQRANAYPPQASGQIFENQTIPSSTATTTSHADGGNTTAMAERDKPQIYRCSTLRPSSGNMVRSGQYEYGKSSFGGKPSILNCPLPAIPSSFDEKSESGETREKVQYSMSRTLGRPMKNTSKHIPPPIITDAFRPQTAATLDTAKQPSSTAEPHPKQQQQIPPAANKQQNQPLPTPPQSPQPTAFDEQQQQSIQSDAAQSQSASVDINSDGAAANPIDESNYAVTEL